MLSTLEQQFTLRKEKLLELTHHFAELYTYGLGTKGADMPMIPSFGEQKEDLCVTNFLADSHAQPSTVTGLPDGTEKGTFLAMDLGGTNLRVCAVKLGGDRTFTIKQEKYRVSDALKMGPVADLFDYMAQSVDTFLTDYGREVLDQDEVEDELNMGFTFSFVSVPSLAR